MKDFSLNSLYVIPPIFNKNYNHKPINCKENVLNLSIPEKRPLDKS